MSSLIVIAAPAEEPVSLIEAKLHLRVDTDDDDNLITGLIKAAREYCEDAQGRAYVTRTYQYITEAVSTIELPMPPFDSLTSVKARLSDNTEVAIDADDYELDVDNVCAKLTVEEYPADAEKVIIVFDAGYGDAVDVPQTIKQAMLLLIGFWYEHRETAEGGSVVSEIPFAVTALLNQNRISWV